MQQNLETDVDARRIKEAQGNTEGLSTGFPHRSHHLTTERGKKGEEQRKKRKRTEKKKKERKIEKEKNNRKTQKRERRTYGQTF